MTQQTQFLDVIDRDKAQALFEAAISTRPLGEECIELPQGLGRVLARDVVANVNVPSFDRSNLDGFAVRAADTVGAEEHQPVFLSLLDDGIAAGRVGLMSLEPGTAVPIATGGMLPRGADAIVMIEHADPDGNQLRVSKPVSAGTGVAFAGTDVACGELILHRGDRLSSRETGILAAIGEQRIQVWKRPRVAVISTGNEIIAPGQPMQAGLVYDSNARILADAVKEQGGEPLELGIAIDDLGQLREKVDQALAVADVILLSGGTSKGQGDLSYQVVQAFDDPGIIVHGVALKPGKPICLAATQGKPVVVLPGFPTSAIFTFHEFVAPLIRRLAGLATDSPNLRTAELAVRINSEVGRKEYLLVGLVQKQLSDSEQNTALTAYPIGKGSGSVTTFSRADGFVSIDRYEELIEAGTPVQVQLISRDLRLADLVIMGSHCTGLDRLMSVLKHQGIQTKFFAIGSSAGLAAVQRGQCDIAGLHLFDAVTQTYNQTCIHEGLTLIHGYRRKQGLVFRKGDPRFQGNDVADIIQRIKQDPDCLMINRNLGSGTRILIDQYLAGSHPNGYVIQTSNHRAVAAAVQQGRADWGFAIESAVTADTLAFLPVQDEQYDFVVSQSGLDKPAVQAFITLLNSEDFSIQLRAMEFERSVSTD